MSNTQGVVASAVQEEVREVRVCEMIDGVWMKQLSKVPLWRCAACTITAGSGANEYDCSRYYCLLCSINGAHSLFHAPYLTILHLPCIKAQKAEVSGPSCQLLQVDQTNALQVSLQIHPFLNFVSRPFLVLFRRPLAQLIVSWFTKYSSHPQNPHYPHSEHSPPYSWAALELTPAGSPSSHCGSP